MTVVGFHASHEQVHPSALLAAVRSEEAALVFGSQVLPQLGVTAP